MRIPFALLALSLLFTAGCGGMKTGTITGTVSVKGKALPGGTISFVSKDHFELPPVTAMIQPDGTYRAEGVPFGELCIGIANPNDSEDIAKKQKEEQGAFLAAAKNYVPKPIPPKKNTVDAKYQDPLNSGLTFTLSAIEVSRNVDLP